MKVGNYYVSHCIDAAFEAYEMNENEEEWGRNSSYACIFCQVYEDEDETIEVDYFVIHKDEVLSYLGLDENANILDVDLDDVFYKMAEDGDYLQYFISC